mmetsp:Transcript_32412/g.39233  ORF Transcript_32412/g.39233 Transcript_32412/m.39233 type:complete len:144 (+) Transcript_32412:120-551(+)|eukprot:CAMPEP_0197847072 /NCGR_PEP_ID=MMETSP1438-20131217/5184_1 /TAXON_ID=1461541 /ORGANISM="Pterosperma sp., Strain CCMP1384" /LENGTH=143 /DNA_ID=CAMNT_0043458889 /DNA_START=115 /DNA_END=546 /DNA_ORIENTATION=-
MGNCCSPAKNAQGENAIAIHSRDPACCGTPSFKTSGMCSQGFEPEGNSKYSGALQDLAPLMADAQEIAKFRGGCCDDGAHAVVDKLKESGWEAKANEVLVKHGFKCDIHLHVQYNGQSTTFHPMIRIFQADAVTAAPGAVEMN